MSLIIPIDYVSISLNHVHQFDPDPWVVTFGLDLRNATQEDRVVLLQATATLWVADIMGVMDSQVTLQSITGRFGQDGDPLTVEATVGSPGTSTSDKTPQNCALHVRKYTALGGRRGKGRFFVPGMLSRNEVSEVGQITQSTVDAFQGYFDTFLDHLGADNNLNGPTPMCLLHNEEGSQPVPAPTEVTNLQVDNLLSTQRRRLR